MRSTKTKLDTIYLWVNLKRQCFYLNYLKRLLPIILLFLTTNFSAYSQKNEFRLSYYTPHVEKIEDLSFLESVEFRNHNMNLLYYRDLLNISDNSKIRLLLGFEYAWFNLNTVYKDNTNINYEVTEIYTDNYGLKVGLNTNYDIYKRPKYSVLLDASYSILARYPILSIGGLGVIYDDSTTYVFRYQTEDTGESLINHSIDLSLIYKRRINNVVSINFGINFLMYLKTYRKIDYYAVSSVDPIISNSLSYYYKQIGFSVGVTF